MLASLSHPSHIGILCSWGFMSLVHEARPSGQRKRCSNRFPTDLSLGCRLPATSIILGISQQ
ncbi:hypothetical protein C5188_16905 [Serratia liquefaciens]|nr:hypothetical protein C5188_16905 [Serratia liquefaciens]HCR61643.1 hypothetical protein [Serratia liquefaciens]